MLPVLVGSGSIRGIPWKPHGSPRCPHRCPWAAHRTRGSFQGRRSTFMEHEHIIVTDRMFFFQKPKEMHGHMLNILSFLLRLGFLSEPVRKHFRIEPTLHKFSCTRRCVQYLCTGRGMVFQQDETFLPPTFLTKRHLICLGIRLRNVVVTCFND